MKKFRMFALLLALAPMLATAQDGEAEPGKGMRGGGDRMTRMQENLGLSDEQVQQVLDLRESGGGRDEFRAILNEEQLQRLDERRSQMKGKRGKGKGQGKGHGMGNGIGTDADNGNEDLLKMEASDAGETA